MSFPSQPAAPGMTPASRETVLIVEDDPGNAATLDLLLQMENRYQVLGFRNGGEVLANLDIIQAYHPALFLLDYLLPRMNGLELYNRLHATEGLDHVPVMFVTGGQMSEEQSITLTERGLCVVEKPYDIDDMLEIIRESIAQNSDVS